MNSKASLQLVVFDWAGTTVDHGCFAPVAAFIETFRRCGIEISNEQARRPMGLHKRDHIRAILEQNEDVSSRWREVNQRAWNDDDVQSMFTDHFTPLQLDVVGDHSDLIPGLLECVDKLRSRGMKIGTSTGYFRAAAEIAYRLAAEAGYRPDHNVCAEDVNEARPAPWMIYRNMEALGVYPPRRVVKVGDTVPDVREGCNAGVWSVGVTHTSSLLGLTRDELQGLDASERNARVADARETLLQAGADFVIDDVTQLPDLLPEMEAAARD